MKIRNWGAIVAIVATGALALAGCSTATAGSSGSANTLTILWEPGQKAGLDPVVAAFEKANPGVKVNVTYSPYDNLVATLRTQLASGTAADIFYTNPGDGNANTVKQLGPSGYLADLSNEAWAAKVPAGVRATFESGGKTMMFAPSVSSIGPIYDDATLKEVGGTIPTTFSEVLALCDTAKKAGKVAYAMGGQTLWVNSNAMLALLASTVPALSPDFNAKRAAGTTTFAADPAYQAAINAYAKMRDAGCFNASTAGTSLDQATQLIATHGALAAIQVAWFANSFQQAAPKDSFTIAPLPASDNVSQSLLTTASISGAGVYAKSKNLDLAKKFMAFLTDPAQENAYTKSIGLAIPTIPNDSFDYSDPNAKTIQTAANAPTVFPFADQAYPKPKVKSSMDSDLQGMIGSGSPTPSQVLANLDAAWNS